MPPKNKKKRADLESDEEVKKPAQKKSAKITKNAEIAY